MIINLDLQVNRRSHKWYVFCLYATISVQVKRQNIRVMSEWCILKDKIHVYDQITPPPSPKKKKKLTNSYAVSYENQIKYIYIILY